MKNEAHARIKINQLLEEAEWRFFDNEQGSANILLENHVKITQTEVDAWGNVFFAPNMDVTKSSDYSPVPTFLY
jgi:type I restriction enzyme R subunit